MSTHIISSISVNMRRMNLRPRFRQKLALCLVLLLAAVSVGQRRTPTSEPKRPRLVLLIVVDQFRYDYLERSEICLSLMAWEDCCARARRGLNQTTITCRLIRRLVMRP